MRAKTQIPLSQLAVLIVVAWPAGYLMGHVVMLDAAQAWGWREYSIGVVLGVQLIFSGLAWNWAQKSKKET